VQAGPIAWSVLDGRLSLDHPTGVRCPQIGIRADEGWRYLTLRLSGLVQGSQYGQATVSSDAVRLFVDGQPVDPVKGEGRPNIAEGSAYEFELTWVVPEAPATLALEVGTGTETPVTNPLIVGEPDGDAGAGEPGEAPLPDV
jgi:hypothetical protein